MSGDETSLPQLFRAVVLGLNALPRPVSGIRRACPVSALLGLVLTECGDHRRLPSERRMAELLGISRAEVRALLAQLRRDGLVRTRRQSGSYLVVNRE
jgi:hypothetical protein